MKYLATINTQPSFNIWMMWPLQKQEIIDPLDYQSAVTLMDDDDALVYRNLLDRKSLVNMQGNLGTKKTVCPH